VAAARSQSGTLSARRHDDVAAVEMMKSPYSYRPRLTSVVLLLLLLQA